MSDLDKLAENRTPILLAEIGTYLHLIGRFSDDFIRVQAKNGKNNFDYKNVCDMPDFFEDTELDRLLKDKTWESLLNNFKNLHGAGKLSSNKTGNFCEFIKKHAGRDNSSGLCEILRDAHGIVSGIDKGVAGSGDLGKQRTVYTFRATGFGYEREIELIGSANLDMADVDKIKGIKKEFFKKIKDILEEIKEKGRVSRENYFEFVSIIREYYSKTIGETRRPINEISLYDYAHTIASLMKSNLAKMVTDGWYNPKGKSKWRILKINMDITGLLSKSLKIGDVLGYEKEIEDTFKEIKGIIEFEYPLGNEIYRDSTGIYFSCPDVDDANKLKLQIFDKLAGLNKLDFSIQIEVSDSSRSMVILSSEIGESLKTISYPHVDYAKHLEEGCENSIRGGNNEVCPVCRIRLKPEDEERCKDCKNRYERRVKAWMDEDKPYGETIWLDEVADKNDIVALIVGQFDLRKWLSGEFIDTFVSQTFDEWKRSLSKKNRNFLEKNMKIQTLNDLETFFKDLFSNKRELQEKMLEILDKLIYIEDKEVAERKQDPKNPKQTKTEYHPNKFDMDKHIWQPIAERDATGKELILNDSSEKARHLIKLLFRKHPSLARIYRIWNTTQEFTDDIIFEKILKEYKWNSELRRQRIQFKIEPNPDIPEGVTCDIDIDGLRFSPVCIDRENGIFTSTINLEILKKFGNSIDEISKNLYEIEIKIKTERNKIWKNEKDGRPFRIKEAKPADERFQNYLPYMKIYDFPDQFMMIVPAFEALDIAEKVLNEYEIQFSKVRDRLPFHLGIIAFHRKTPLYMVMDAGKRLIKAFKKQSEEFEEKMEKDEIEIKIISTKDGGNGKLGKYKELEIEAEDYSSVPLKWKISYSTGDPGIEDLWHPYIRFNGGNPHRNLYFDYTGNDNYVIHVKELKQNDGIKIEPSYFKLSYLENVSDRFKIGDNLKPLDDIHRIEDLWEKLKSRAPSISRIYSFWMEVEKRRSYKNHEFEKFIESSLINILNINPQKDKELFEEFLETTKDGLLDLCIHWNLQVRKIKLIGDGGE